MAKAFSHSFCVTVKQRQRQRSPPPPSLSLSLRSRGIGNWDHHFTIRGVDRVRARPHARAGVSGIPGEDCATPPASRRRRRATWPGLVGCGGGEITHSPRVTCPCPRPLDAGLRNRARFGACITACPFKKPRRRISLEIRGPRLRACERGRRGSKGAVVAVVVAGCRCIRQPLVVPCCPPG